MKATGNIGRLAGLVLVLLVLGFSYGQVFAADWPNWRGLKHCGFSPETDWSADWDSAGPKVLWRASVGNGFSSIVVADGRAYTMGNTGTKKTSPDDADIVFCFDAVTGKEIWRYKYPCPLEPKYYPEGGTLSTPTVDGDRVYTVSKMGDMFCFNAATGGVIWEKQLNKDMGFKLPTWHFASSGLIAGDMIIYNIGAAGVALNKKTGQIVWQNGKSECGYATPVPYTMNDQDCVAIFGKDTIASVRVSDGKTLWSYPWETKHFVNASDPVVAAGKVFISSGYNKGCALLDISGNAGATEIWRNKEMRNHMNCSMLWKGHIYGFDESTLKCIDAKDGSEKWSDRTMGKGALMMSTDGRMIIMGDKGELVIAMADPDGFKAMGRAQILPEGKCWTVPVLANGRIYARNASGQVVCVNVTAGGAAASRDWPQWHGPNRDAKSTETGLLKSWPAEGPKMIWSTAGLGLGWSTVSIADGMIYTTGMDKQTKQGWLFAFDMDGKPKWKQPYGPEWSKSHAGARCTPTVEDGLVYVISGSGRVGCFDAKSGKEQWLVNPFEEYEGQYGRWGIAESPLVVDDKVIFTVGGKKAAMVALNRMTGQVVWAAKSVDDRSAYCSPMLVQRSGRKVIVTMLGESLIGVDAADGAILWQDMFADYLETNKDTNPITPIQHDGSIYATSGYNCGGTLLALSPDGTKFTRKWVDTTLDCHHGGVIVLDGYIYGANWQSNSKGKWVCLDWKTGKVMYEQEWFCKGAITCADGMFYCYEEKGGTMGLVRPTPEKFDVVSSFSITLGDGKHWAHPVICDGRLYVRHGDVLMAYDVKAK